MQRIDIIGILAERLSQRGWMLACAESCTGGGIAAALTDVAGSSAWFDRGFVTYSNQAKQDMLGVAPDTILAHGAVSRDAAIEMASGALANSQAQLAVAVTGVAGPGGGTPDKPVGTVWFCWVAAEHQPLAVCEHFDGDRAAVRSAAVDRGLRGLMEMLD
jgi:nicotinamide-nucleotide amidase